MGSLLMPLFCPATRNVSCSISRRISSNSVKRLSICRNWPHSLYVCVGESGTGVWMSWRTSGRLVTIPEPRGRKSRPTILFGGQTAEMEESESDVRFENTGLSRRLASHLFHKLRMPLTIEMTQTYDSQLGHVQLPACARVSVAQTSGCGGDSPRLANVSCS